MCGYTVYRGVHMNEFAMRRNWGPKPNYPLVIAYKNKKPGFIKIAGPCSVESEEQIYQTARAVADAGATHLRGGVFRAGTYPGSNFGWVDESLLYAYQYAAKSFGLKNIIEVLEYSEQSFELISKYCDCFQVGARSMQNYSLLRKVAKAGKPIFLKRHPGSTLDELLGSAEHILKSGSESGQDVELYLIERGSSSNANHVRWDLSISIIPATKAITEIPVIVDASHGTGRRDLVWPMTLAGVAAGAGGCLVEVHHNPEKSLSDADQAIDFVTYAKLSKTIDQIRGII